MAREHSWSLSKAHRSSNDGEIARGSEVLEKNTEKRGMQEEKRAEGHERMQLFHINYRMLNSYVEPFAQQGGNRAHS